MEGISIKLHKFLAVFLAVTLLFVPVVRGESLSARSAVVISADTLEIIFQKNAEQKLSMASTTKIMTGLLLAESGKLDEEALCSKKAVTVEGSALGLKAGDKISGRDLLVGLMLRSGNDAANVAAEFVSGDIEGFVQLMNEKATELGLLNTSFETPSGLDGEAHYTTAYDLAVLTAYALKNEEFAETVAKKTAEVSFGNPKKQYRIKNHNRLLSEFEGCIGVKTGFTKKSGRCLVTAADGDGKRVVAVTLNASDDWNDHRALLERGLSSAKTETLIQPPFEVSVSGGEKGTVKTEEIKFSFCRAEGNEKSFNVKIKTEPLIAAPVTKGDKIGLAELCLGEQVIKSADIIAGESVLALPPPEKSFFEKLLECIVFMIKSF